MPSMAQPKLPAELVPEALKPLVEQLASLPEEQREAVIHAARRERSTLKLRAVPWDHLLAVWDRSCRLASSPASCTRPNSSLPQLEATASSCATRL